MGQTILDELIVALEHQEGRSRVSVKDYGFKSWLDVLKQAREVMISLGEAANEYYPREILRLREENYFLHQRIEKLNKNQ